MQNAKRYFINGVMLAAVTIGLRAIGVSFNAYVTRKLGSEAVGLFTLVMSVYSLALTVASSAVNLASVRMTSETLARLEASNATGDKIRRALRRDMRGCVCYSLFFGLITGFVTFILSPVIGTYLLCDTRTIMSLRVFSVSLPATSLGSALAGYFTGVRKVYKNAVIALIEQFVKIVLISGGLVILAPRGIEYACVAVVGGGALAEGASLLTSFIFYMLDKIKASGTAKPMSEKKSALTKAAEIAFPVALGSYVRQGLVCAEHIAIPAGLKKSGSNAGTAISSYGVLHGMVFPLIFFPASVLSAFAMLLVPELSGCLATDNMKRASAITVKVIKTCLVFSIAVAGVYIAFSSLFGLAVYDSFEAGKYIAIIAPLIPVMYLDTSVDAVLKGLGQQVYSMKVNILDASLSLILVLLLVPSFGLLGYIISVYAVEIVNCALSLSRLISVTGVKIKAGWVVRPGLATFASVFIMKLIYSRPSFMTVSSPLQLASAIIVMLLFMRILGAINKKDIKYFKNTISPVNNL